MPELGKTAGDPAMQRSSARAGVVVEEVVDGGARWHSPRARSGRRARGRGDPWRWWLGHARGRRRRREGGMAKLGFARGRGGILVGVGAEREAAGWPTCVQNPAMAGKMAPRLCLMNRERG